MTGSTCDRPRPSPSGLPPETGARRGQARARPRLSRRSPSSGRCPPPGSPRDPGRVEQRRDHVVGNRNPGRSLHMILLVVFGLGLAYKGRWAPFLIGSAPPIVWIVGYFAAARKPGNRRRPDRGRRSGAESHARFPAVLLLGLSTGHKIGLGLAVAGLRRLLPDRLAPRAAVLPAVPPAAGCASSSSPACCCSSG